MTHEAIRRTSAPRNGVSSRRWKLRLRSLEHLFKALLYQGIATLMPQPRAAAPLNWSARPHRVLYLRFDRLGDMVLATGIIRAIVVAQPTVSVDVLASTYNAAVLRGNPYVREVFPIGKRRPLSSLVTLLRLRRMRYDAVMDTMVLAPSLTTLLLMWASGAQHRIGVAGRGNDFALTLPVSRARSATHYVDHSAALLAAFGVDPCREAPKTTAANGWGAWRPQVFLTPTELEQGEQRWRTMTRRNVEEPSTPRRLLANVSAGSSWRYWPQDSFVETLRRIRKLVPDVSILIIGSPQDRDRMVRIGRGAATPVAFTRHYRQMMAILAACDFVLTADTAATHVASAFCKPTVVMFSGGCGPLYGPYATPGRVVTTFGSTLATLEVEPVVEALQTIITDARARIDGHARPTP